MSAADVFNIVTSVTKYTLLIGIYVLEVIDKPPTEPCHVAETSAELVLYAKCRS